MLHPHPNSSLPPPKPHRPVSETSSNATTAGSSSASSIGSVGSPGLHLLVDDEDAGASSDDQAPSSTSSSAPTMRLPTVAMRREVSEEMDTQDAEAASILSKVLPDMQKLTNTLDHPRGSSGRGGARRGGVKGYEDLLDCLASLASHRAPEPALHRRVSRMTVDDMELQARRGASSFSSPFASLPSAARMEESDDDNSDDEEEEDEDDGRYYYAAAARDRRTQAFAGRRPRAASNPEGCDVWRRYENAAVATLVDRGSSSHAHNSGGPGLPPRVPTASHDPTSARSLAAASASAAATAAAAAVAAAAAAAGPGNVNTILPHMLAKYADLYNKHGRIGIYTREERDAIIARFREKRLRRVWKKKIRYSCRKNLADKRIRVKGRFVKLPPTAKEGEDEEEGDKKVPRTLSGSTLSVIAEGAPSVDEEEEGGDSEEEEKPVRRMRRHSIAF